MMSHFPTTSHPCGITTVDAEYVRPGFASVHVIERAGRAAIVDTGTNDSVPLVLQALEALGLAPDAVDFVFITHVHLDHAGGAGALLRALPRARAVAHPRSVPHLRDPSRLIEASRVVYGDARFDALYGTPLPIAPERVAETQEGERLRLGGSQFQVLHTPGHALHHHVLHDLDARAVFTGDTFGLSYRALDTARGPFIVPTTTPTQFDPDQLVASVRRVVALAPEALFLTHNGRVTGAQRLGAELEEQIASHVAIARRHATASDREHAIREALRRVWIERLEAHGAPAAAVDDWLAGDLELNTQGLIAWLQRSERGR
jgi:glyoxylase-like metal-dependent hydrolase (beta-lactamase superfamily II)